MVGEHLLSAGKSEEEERDGAHEFTNNSDSMPPSCGRKCTEESAQRPVHRGGGGCFSVHNGEDRLGWTMSRAQREIDRYQMQELCIYVRNIQPWRHSEKRRAFPIVLFILSTTNTSRKVFRKIISFMDAPKLSQELDIKLLCSKRRSQPQIVLGWTAFGLSFLASRDRSFQSS